MSADKESASKRKEEPSEACCENCAGTGMVVHKGMAMMVCMVDCPVCEGSGLKLLTLVKSSGSCPKFPRSPR
jgi:DnaJ-class molecular chaperone